MGNDKIKMLMLGALGEKIVRCLAQNQGMMVKEPMSMYASDKDLLINDKTCEVKTQRRWVTEDAFTVKANQVRKCTNVDLLFFVEQPAMGEKEIRIYECPPEQRRWRTRITRDGRTMHLLNRRDMNLVEIVTDEQIISEMQSFSNSEW